MNIKKLQSICYEMRKTILETSFNCQEPIVETPKHALRTFKRTALDLLVINDYIIRK